MLQWQLDLLLHNQIQYSLKPLTSLHIFLIQDSFYLFKEERRQSIRILSRKCCKEVTHLHGSRERIARALLGRGQP